ncbi:hypothetical protein G0U57_015850, partial [Chelydra serpentina]
FQISDLPRQMYYCTLGEITFLWKNENRTEKNPVPDSIFLLLPWGQCLKESPTVDPLVLLFSSLVFRGFVMGFWEGEGRLKRSLWAYPCRRGQVSTVIKRWSIFSAWQTLGCLCRERAGGNRDMKLTKACSETSTTALLTLPGCRMTRTSRSTSSRPPMGQGRDMAAEEPVQGPVTF